MLPKIHRLKKNTEIKRVLDKGKKFKENFLILKIFPNTLNQTRFAFIVSKKISKNSPHRNKIKRRLREIVRGKLAKIKKGTDIATIAIQGLETKTFKEIDKDLNELFKKAKILKP